ncbi:MAG: mevalonate kinase [Sandaracinaceae bacterium]
MRGRGHGKVILLGEHAVVHGVPAIAVGLPDGASAETVERAETPTLRVAPWGVVAVRGGDDPLAVAFDALLRAREAAGGGARSASVDATVSLPGSAGLGSSAALGVAVLRALDARDGIARDFDALQRIALAWERVFHGNPSGIDTAMAISGGLARYVRHPLAGERALMPIRSRAPITLVIGHSGQEGSTKAMVEQVARLKERAPERFAQTLEALDALVQNGLRAIEEGELVALGQLFDLAQKLLSSWLVSTDVLEAMCAEARRAGALGAKLTGGGGGGCMIALVPDPHADPKGTSAAVKQALEAMGHRAFEARIEATASAGSEERA